MLDGQPVCCTCADRVDDHVELALDRGGRRGRPESLRDFEAILGEIAHGHVVGHETGSDERIANMYAFAAAALQLFAEVLERER